MYGSMKTEKDALFIAWIILYEIKWNNDIYNAPFSYKYDSKRGATVYKMKNTYSASIELLRKLTITMSYHYPINLFLNKDEMIKSKI